MKRVARFLCFLGFHPRRLADFNDDFVGLLYRRCKICAKVVKVADEFNYKPDLGREKGLTKKETERNG